MAEVTQNFYGNVIFNDGATQNGDIHITNPTYNYNGRIFGEDNANSEENTTDEVLTRYIPDVKKVREYAAALRLCKNAKEIAFVVKDMYDQHLENDDIIVSKSFLEVIQGYTNWKGNSIDNLRNFIKKIVLGL